MLISASVPSLYLDPQIRDWVLFPITLVMVWRSSSVAVLALTPWSILDTSRGIEALCRRPFTVVANKASTGGYPRAVRTRI
jgi:hypothetical protein